MTNRSTTPCLPQSEIETAEHVPDTGSIRSKLGFAVELANFCKPCSKPNSTRCLPARATPAASRRATDSEETVGVTGHRHGHRSRSLLGTFNARALPTCPQRQQQQQAFAMVG